jgi:hypothetical protein
MDYDPRSEPHNLAHDPTTLKCHACTVGIAPIERAGVGNIAQARCPCGTI